MMGRKEEGDKAEQEVEKNKYFFRRVLSHSFLF